MWSAPLRGGVSAVGLAFPLAAICALLYRLPVPFVGYENGPAAMGPALLALLFYGLFLGGFAALFVAGALGGAVGYVLGKPDAQRVRRLTLIFAGMVAALGVGLMAVLDKLIGPW